MPGIIADVYGRGAVIQISSYGADRLRREIVEGFRMAGYRWLYEKSDSYARRQEGLEPYGTEDGDVPGPEAELGCSGTYDERKEEGSGRLLVYGWLYFTPSEVRS